MGDRLSDRSRLSPPPKPDLYTCLPAPSTVLALSRTIAQNIAYGAAGAGHGGPPEAASTGTGKTTDLGGGVTMDKVVEAAEFANAKGFVEEFPDG